MKPAPPVTRSFPIALTSGPHRRSHIPLLTASRVLRRWAQGNQAQDLLLLRMRGNWIVSALRAECGLSIQSSVPALEKYHIGKPIERHHRNVVDAAVHASQQHVKDEAF